MQKKLEAKELLTDIIRQFYKENKNDTQTSEVKSIEFKIMAMSNKQSLFVGAGRGPTRNNHYQNATQNQVKLCSC